MPRPKRTTPLTATRARELRHNLTQPEAKLWAYLRANRLNEAKFRRQHAIGPYITDFCSPSHKLVIELDGSGHLELHEYDAQRTAYLESHGYRVLRFYNHEVENDLETVLGVILENLDPTIPSPNVRR